MPVISTSTRRHTRQAYRLASKGKLLALGVYPETTLAEARGRPAIAILRELYPLTGPDGYVFPRPRGSTRPLSDNAVLAAMRSLGIGKDAMCGHGFRAMARTILDEVLNYRVDWIEHQPAHAVKDINGRAYNRMAHLEGRRQMMQGWADYLGMLRSQASGSNIVPIQQNHVETQQ